MGGNLLSNYGEAIAMILFGIGFSNLLAEEPDKENNRAEYHGYRGLPVPCRKRLYHGT